MELTKKQAIEEHRKMWNWIADAIKNKEDWSVVESCYDWSSLITDLKRHYLLNYEGQKYKDIRSACFCCEYDSYYDDDHCRHCPVIWGSPTGCCCVEYGEYTELVTLDGYSDENKEIAYELALDIANLPESEDV